MTAPKNRDFTLDILRGCGLFLIILAHCEPPKFLFQLRNFDVPLMVIISAATFAMIYKTKAINIREFYIKRIKRLVVPAWYFLSFFFVSIFLGSYILKTAYPFSLTEIISSYSFYSGIGYVWFLRIFLFIALLTPPLLLFKQKVTNNITYAAIVLAIYMLYDLIAAQLYNTNPTEAELGILGTVFLPLIPYAALYAYGLRLEDISNKLLLIIAFISLAIFMGLGFYYYFNAGEIVPTQYLKYPPRLYYISYAIFSTNILYLLVKTYYPHNFLKPFISWVSLNSLWIYLWHIYAIFLWDLFFAPTGHSLTLSLSKYLFVCVTAMLTTHVQSTLALKVKTKTS